MVGRFILNQTVVTISLIPNPEISFQKAKLKPPNAMLMEMCLNETGTCGRI
jgi:hypothetical protein